MNRPSILLLLSLTVCGFLPGCANPRFLPTTRPLFVGFEEQHLSGDKLVALERAKVDFQRARGGKAPVYARHLRTLPYSRSEVSKGDGYEITLVDEPALHGHDFGPRIILGPELTGGRPYSYDEVTNIWD